MVAYLIVNKQYTDLVNEYFQRWSRVAFHQTAGIIKLPVVSVGSEVEGQGFLMAGAWMANGGKGGHRFVLPSLLQRADNGTMAAHARAKSGLNSSNSDTKFNNNNNIHIYLAETGHIYRIFT